MNEEYLISKHRNFLMGGAILWIMLFHSSLTIENEIFSTFKWLGYGGVDIFIFLSGFGIAHSLSKNLDTLEFLKKRMMRIIPAYYIMLVLYYTKRYIFEDTISIYEVIGDFTFTGFWGGIVHYNWYLHGIVLFYLLSPMFYQLLKGATKKTLVIIFVVSILISVAFFYNYILIATSRIPLYLIGMYYGIYGKEYKMLQGKKLSIYGGLFLIGVVTMVYCFYVYDYLLWNFGLWWFPFIIIVPPYCVLSSHLMEKIKEWKVVSWFYHLITWIGKNSFEIYLLHMLAFDCGKKVLDMNNGLWILIGILSIIGGAVFKYCLEKILGKGLYLFSSQE